MTYNEKLQKIRFWIYGVGLVVLALGATWKFVIR
jgi:hypothetical protein